MKTINISKKKYQELKNLNLAEGILSTEANLHILDYHGKKLVFKKLLENEEISTYFANKLYTVEMLNSYQSILPHEFVIPSALCTVQGITKGFVLPYIDGRNFEEYLNDKNISPKEKMYFFKRIGDLLEQLKHIRENSELDDIFIGDLHASNFLIDKNKGTIKVIDLDSCKICDNKPFPARYLTPTGLLSKTNTQKYIKNNHQKDQLYQNLTTLQIMKLEMQMQKEGKNYQSKEGCIIPNEASDLYCYTITFLNYLYGRNVNLMTPQEFYEYLNYLEYLKYDTNLVNAISKLILDADNENIGNYLPYLSDEQIYRARERIYKLNR